MILQSTKKLTYDDLVWWYGATQEALARVKDIGRKQAAQVDGEVFTTMRRLATESGSHAVKQVFSGSMKHFPYRLDTRIGVGEKEVIIAMYDKLKGRRQSEEPIPPDVRDLEIILLAAQASVKGAERVANESTKVREGLDKIQDILDGKQD